jgi:hypothetical protein
MASLALLLGLLLAPLAALHAADSPQKSPVAFAAEQWAVFETSFTSARKYGNPFMELEVDVLFSRGNEQWRVPAFWAGGDRWTVRFAPPVPGDYTFQPRSSDPANSIANGTAQTLHVTAYTGEIPLLQHGPLRVTGDKRHFEYADGTPFLWLGDTWWKGLCKRLTWGGFQELTADRKKKGFNVVQIVCGTYPDERGMLQPSWENEGGMPYLNKDFSEMNPAYFDHADRRIKHLVEAGIVPAITGGWGRAVGFNAVGLPGYKRHFRNLIARYGAYPVVWILGGETDKRQGPWYELARYVREMDPYGRLLGNHSSLLRKALEDHVVFDFDMDATGHAAWRTVGAAIKNCQQSLNESPQKPFVSGESCYEMHMQENPASLQRHQFWALMLAGAAGQTYGAAGVWHMATPEEHGNWGGWGGQPYDLTTWREGMHFAGSTQLGHAKALLEKLPWQQFREHPEWVAKDVFAAGIPDKIRVIYQPTRGVYQWGGITVSHIEPGTYSAFYFDPVSGRRYDLGLHHLSGTWQSPNVPSPQDWVLVMQAQGAQARPETVTLPEIQVGQSCSGKLPPTGGVFTLRADSKWLTIHADGSYSGTPGDSHTGRHSFLLSVKKPNGSKTLLELTVNVLGTDGEIFSERFDGYQGTQNATQATTGLNVAHHGTVVGWTGSGRGVLHAVDRSVKGGEATPSDWAIMIFEDNVITSAEIDANAPGVSYRVACETSPAVYSQMAQATQKSDMLRIDLLRQDNSVLKRFEHTPGAWKGRTEFSGIRFDYTGDGSGSLRVRIGPAGSARSGRFAGAVDNLIIRKMK